MDNKLDSRIIATDNFDILIKTQDGTIIDVASIVLEDNAITEVVTVDGDVYTRDLIEVCNKVLYVPGIGYLTPETRVIYKEQDYVLLYGWHTNISNQTILSWYLMPLEECIPYKTLYKDMINDIEVFHFR